MRKTILIITLLSVLVLLSTCAKRKEGYSKLSAHNVNTLEPAIYYACQDQFKLKEKPVQPKDLPKNISGQVSYFIAGIADKYIPIMIDHMNDCKLYLDADADGCLSDEKAFTPKPVKRHLFDRVDHYKFGPITVEFQQTKGKFTKRICIISRDKEMRYITLCPAEYRKGKVLLGDALYEVRVLDGNFDEKYDKIFSPPVENIWRPGCDSFAVDLNRNKKVDFNYSHHSELMPLGRMVKVGNSYYNINITEKGRSIELNKIRPDFGILDLGNEKIKLKLWSDAAQQYITGFGENIRIPAGRYQAFFLELSRKDSKNNTWDFTSYRDTGSLKNFEITKDRMTSFKIGPPFKIETTMRNSGDRVNINFKLIGQASEQYGPDFKRNGKRVSPPILKIIDERDNVVYSDRFEYG
ncbi:MAG: hypothetical protein JW837_15220 [Sedimentisphaerales bacterium]|nr:hypothetical protein [Sedimentisphaerales bacterium]